MNDVINQFIYFSIKTFFSSRGHKRASPLPLNIQEILSSNLLFLTPFLRLRSNQAFNNLTQGYHHDPHYFCHIGIDERKRNGEQKDHWGNKIPVLRCSDRGMGQFLINQSVIFRGMSPERDYRKTWNRIKDC